MAPSIDGAPRTCSRCTTSSSRRSARQAFVDVLRGELAAAFAAITRTERCASVRYVVRSGATSAEEIAAALLAALNDPPMTWPAVVAGVFDVHRSAVPGRRGGQPSSVRIQNNKLPGSRACGRGELARTSWTGRAARGSSRG